MTSAVRVTRWPLVWPDFAALAIVAAILAVVVLVPAAALVARALESAPPVEAASSRGLPELAPAATTAWALLARSLAWSVCAATAGALLGWAAARRALHWRSRAWRGVVACVLVLPIALPPWLLYAGLWLSIGPGTPIGDLAARALPRRDARRGTFPRTRAVHR